MVYIYIKELDSVRGSINLNCVSGSGTVTSKNGTSTSGLNAIIVPGNLSTSTSSSASGSGNSLSEVLKNVFQSLVNAVIKNVKPNLNPNEKGPVYTIIEGTLNLVITIIDKNNKKTVIPIEFTINTKHLLRIKNEAVNSSSGGSLSATSGSIVGTLGQFLQLLIKQIPAIDYNVGNNAGYPGYMPEPVI